MSWARYDDALPYNRKVAWLKSHDTDGLAALSLHLLANCWSRHEGHQGFIPAYIPEQLVGKPWRRLVALLADDGCGMFETIPEGWMINDYDEYGDRDDGVPVDQKKARLSKVRAEAGRAGGKAKAANRPSKPSSKTVAELQAKPQQTSTPVPEPVPVPNVNTLGGHRNEPLPAVSAPEPPRCIAHKGLPEDQVPPCRGCMKAAENASTDLGVEQAADALRAQLAADNCTRCQGSNWITDSDGNPLEKCTHQLQAVAS